MISRIFFLLCLGVCSLSVHAADSKMAAFPNYGKLPANFEVNRGQTDPRVKFLSRGTGYTVFLTANEAVLSLEKGYQRTSVTLNVAGSNPAPAVSGRHELPGTSNYFIGNDPRKWRTNIPSYGEVLYSNVYPKIDLLYHANQRQLEFDFLIAPHADASKIELSFAGASGVRVDDSGDLVVSLNGGEIRFHKPHLYQLQGTSSNARNRRALVDGQYVVAGANRIKFQLPRYDPNRSLVIDPVLSYSTFLGGSSDSFGNAIAVDNNGNAYVTGGTTSSDFPTTRGVFQGSYKGDNGSGYQGVVGDVFVTKLDPTGTRAIYSTYIGGSGGDNAYGIVLDAQGNAYLTGGTNSPDFPETAGAYQPVCCGLTDVFVTKLNPTGSSLIYSTHIGVSGEGTRGFGIGVDGNGAVYVTGNAGPGFPTTTGALKTNCNCFTNGFVMKLNSNATAADYSTFLGGSEVDFGESIAVDSSGKAYVTGYNGSTDFPTTASAFQQSNHGGTDAFVSVFNGTGSALVYSTLLGGSGNEEGFKIAISAGRAYVTGYTSSTDFPTTPGSFQTAFGGGNSDAFVAKIDPTKSGAASLAYSTFLGGSGDENLADYERDILDVDRMGNVYVTGITTSLNFPTLGAIQSTSAGGWDTYVTSLDTTGAHLRFSTYLGGSGDDFGRGIAFGGGYVYVTGQTYSANFPTSSGAFQTVFTGSSDAFVSKIGRFFITGP